MSFNAKKLPFEGKERKRYDPVAPGAYPARVVSLVLLGKQTQKFNGEAKAPAQRLRMTYELLDEFLKDDEGKEMTDKPRWVTQEFNFFSLKSERAISTKIYYALDPEEKYEGDFSKLVGAPCIVTIANEKSKKDDRVFEKVSAVSAMRDKEAAKAPGLVNEPYLFDFYEPDLDIWDRLPEWIQDTIKGAVDFEGGALQKALQKAGKNADAKKVEEDESDEDDSPIIDDDEEDNPW